MATETGNPSSLQILQSNDKLSFLNARTSIPRPPSEATEIFDTDFDDEYIELYAGDSPRRSLATESISTASTPDDVQTPGSLGLTDFHFHFDEKPVRGPVGPHLFRSSLDESELKSSLEVDFILAESEVSPVTPLYRSASTLEPGRKDTPLPNHDQEAPSPQLASLNKAVSELDEAEAGSWTPADVVKWMQNTGFDDSVVEKFFINDISGAILLELQAEDLKELDIHSFGKRHRLMNSIQQLRNSVTLANGDSQPSQPDILRRDSRSVPPPVVAPSENDCNTSPSSDGNKTDSTAKERRRRHRHRRRNTEDIHPGDSASIVAIEQLLPKIHTCSKGQECHKWQKQQRKLARLAQGLPVDSISGSSILTGDPGNPTTAPNLIQHTKSDMSPSVVASSDVLGPQTADFRLCEEKLNEVKPRDPQENVRQFLNFQHLSKLQPVNNPATPPRELFPSPDADSPDSAKTNVTLAENLRHLPKLRIPSMQAPPVGGSLSATLSAQRTVTPSVLKKKPPFSQQGTAIGPDKPSACGSLMSPSDFYRDHFLYRQGTPFSEMDVPLTAIPLGPVPRQDSQSVPPDMRFGSELLPKAEPILRPTSTKAENHRRNTSSHNVPALGRLDEGDVYTPIDTPEDLHSTPRATQYRRSPFSPVNRNANDVTHSGWMKKRKTTRLLRHEWEDHHFTLKGTQLAMHADEQASQRDSKALEYIDVDDYAVACSSLASTSKLTAAFKKTVLKRKGNTVNEAAFAFSLIPAPSNGNAPNVDRRTLFTNGKSHYFAVKTRDERIDWMRELMLAKALKRGKDGGDSMKVNGNNV